MRMLVISDLYPPAAFGGYERTCAELVDALRERHEVTVLTSDLHREAAPPRSWIRRDLTYLGGGRGELARIPKAAARAAAATRRLLDELRPELVYVSNCLGVSQTAPYVAAQTGIPVVYRLSELWYASTLYHRDRFVGYLFPGQRGPHRAWAGVIRAANRHPALRLDAVQSLPAAISWCSDDLRKRTRLPPAVRPVLEQTIYPGVPDRFASLRRRPSTPPTIAYVGRVTAAKGADVAVRALATLRDRHGIDAHLVIAGSWEPGMARRVRQLIAGLGLGERARLIGPLGSEEVEALLERSSAVVVPTVGHEALGAVCLEAGLARVPVVASDVGGIPEALRHGEHALLFPPGDADACAAALASTFTEPASAKARTSRAFAHAAQFSTEHHVTASEAFLEEARAMLGGAA
jgi:glycosyltransferase involved in cell wall biosynthesis